MNIQTNFKTVRVPIKALKLYAKNAKIHTDRQIKLIQNSMKAFGVNTVVGIWGEENLVVFGHGRIEALKRLNSENYEVECIRLDHLTEEQTKAFRLVDNQLNMLTAWEENLLNEELNNIFSFNLEDFGVSKKLPKNKHIPDVVCCPQCGVSFDANNKTPQ